MTALEQKALGEMSDAYHRLMDAGWRQAMYAPENVPLELIEVGSTGIHLGERLADGFWIHDGQTWPSTPCLFREAIRK